MTVTTTLQTFTTCLENFTETHNAVHTARMKATIRLGCAIALSIASLVTCVAGIIGALFVSPYLALLCVVSVLLATLVTILLLKVKIPVIDSGEKASPTLKVCLAEPHETTDTIHQKEQLLATDQTKDTKVSGSSTVVDPTTSIFLPD